MGLDLKLLPSIIEYIHIYCTVHMYGRAKMYLFLFNFIENCDNKKGQTSYFTL